MKVITVIGRLIAYRATSSLLHVPPANTVHETRVYWKEGTERGGGGLLGGVRD